MRISRVWADDDGRGLWAGQNLVPNRSRKWMPRVLMALKRS